MPMATTFTSYRSSQRRRPDDDADGQRHGDAGQRQQSGVHFAGDGERSREHDRGDDGDRARMRTCRRRR